MLIAHQIPQNYSKTTPLDRHAWYKSNIGEVKPTVHWQKLAVGGKAEGGQAGVSCMIKS